nr:MAG TPA: hypothetical protein [Caudoviricetes sp.]
MDRNILNENFTKKERLYLAFNYQVEGTIRTIFRLREKYKGRLNETYHDEMVKDVDAVYSVCKRALKLFPTDEYADQWKDTIKLIEDKFYSIASDNNEEL